MFIFCFNCELTTNTILSLSCAAKVAVQCLPQTMEISVEKCAVDDDLVILAGYATSLSSIPEECQVSDIVDYYNFTVDFDSCKTVAQVCVYKIWFIYTYLLIYFFCQ